MTTIGMFSAVTFEYSNHFGEGKLNGWEMVATFKRGMRNRKRWLRNLFKHVRVCPKMWLSVLISLLSCLQAEICVNDNHHDILFNSQVLLMTTALVLCCCWTPKTWIVVTFLSASWEIYLSISIPVYDCHLWFSTLHHTHGHSSISILIAMNIVWELFFKYHMNPELKILLVFETPVLFPVRMCTYIIQYMFGLLSAETQSSPEPSHSRPRPKIWGRRPRPMPYPRTSQVVLEALWGFHHKN